MAILPCRSEAVDAGLSPVPRFAHDGPLRRLPGRGDQEHVPTGTAWRSRLSRSGGHVDAFFSGIEMTTVTGEQLLEICTYSGTTCLRKG